MKKNIGAALALYPCPVVVVGAMVDGKPNWTLVAHAGIVAHSHLMLSMVQVHYLYLILGSWFANAYDVVPYRYVLDSKKLNTA